jgi:cob(I)alamin adenosyltransferase
MKSRVTTKRGDAGETTALSGVTYSKGHVVLEAVGTLDELRAHLANVRHHILAGSEDAESADFLLYLMHTLFVLGSKCSDPELLKPEYHPYRLEERHLDRLEAEQARLEGLQELPRSFIVSAANIAAAQADMACTVARRLERAVARLAEQHPGFGQGLELAYINRVSDYLFILARSLEHGEHIPVDYSVLDD